VENAPLMNRATMSQLEPGSTIKPAVGLGAITTGQITPTKGIECTGFLVINGKKLPNGRCWVATRWFTKLNGAVAHHPIPSPHKGRYGNPDGWLCFADALERSCNVYFETCADKLGLVGLSDWLDHMGLGHETGIGIFEARGRLPRDLVASQVGAAGGGGSLPRSVVWFSGIGQSGVLATPIQMANIAATIARDGIWMRPRLIENANVDLAPWKPRGGGTIPDQLDLHIDQQALKAAREGMVNVVNSEAGTGRQAHMDNLLVAGKTGTAQASKLPDRRLPDGTLVARVPATADNPTDTPWYRGWGEDGTQLNHGWFIGFAPADHPQVAFAVMIQYGGSGGFAGHVATQVLDRCIAHGYVSTRRQ
jgi:penicillin-binding protein 2